MWFAKTDLINTPGHWKWWLKAIMLTLLIVQHLIDLSTELLIATIPFALLLPSHNQVSSFAAFRQMIYGHENNLRTISVSSQTQLSQPRTAIIQRLQAWTRSNSKEELKIWSYFWSHDSKWNFQNNVHFKSRNQVWPIEQQCVLLVCFLVLLFVFHFLFFY